MRGPGTQPPPLPRARVRVLILLLGLLLVLFASSTSGAAVSAAKLVIRVCNGPACTEACNPQRIAEAIDASAPELDVSYSRCYGWCKKGLNVKVISDGSAEGIKLPTGMTDAELNDRCFHSVREADAGRIATAVRDFIREEDEKKAKKGTR